MRLTKKDLFAYNSLITLKDDVWLSKQRVAGKVVAGALNLLQALVIDKTTKSLLELNSLAEEYITSKGCECTFKGYKGFPAGVCISVNEVLVHGIPTDYKLQEGDLVSFDLGATYEGTIADSAITCIYGTPKSELHIKLIEATKTSLLRGIASISVGKRLGSIGHAIYKSGKGAGFNVITNYGGHGLDYHIPHATPFVANKSNPEDGIVIQPGLALAIEPMLVLGSTESYIAKNGWDVITSSLGAHFEHSVYVHQDRVEILTARS